MIPANRPDAIRCTLTALLLVGCLCGCGEERVSSVGPQTAPQIEGLLMQLQELHGRGRSTEGAALAREALTTNPDHPGLRVALGLLLGLGDDHEAAIEEFRRALSIEPDRFDAWLGVATAMTRLGRTSESIEPLQRCLELRPDNRDVRFQLGRNLSGLGRYAEAEAALRQAAVDQPNADTFAELGLLENRRGDRSAAEREFREALRVEPGHRTALYNLGRLLLHRSDGVGQRLLNRHTALATEDDRREYYLNAVRRPGAGISSYLALAELHASAGAMDEAIEAYAAVLARNPDRVPAALGLATVHLRRGELEAATGWVVHALTLDPGSSRANLLLGIMRIHRNQTGPALQAFTASRKSAEWTAETYAYVGGVYRRTGHRDPAIDAYQDALSLSPGLAGARVALAECLFLEDHPQAALAQVRQVTDHSPDFAPGWMLEGILELTAGHEAVARRALGRARELYAVERLWHEVEPGQRFADLPGGAAALSLYDTLSDPL
jgi:tetratricopeptide (TPR) repeat protein